MQNQVSTTQVGTWVTYEAEEESDYGYQTGFTNCCDRRGDIGHLIHPRIPRLAFAGFNHGYMHVTSLEIGTLWLCAYLRGELELPP
ncbi:MAG: hypothetical protein ABI621_01565 [Chloroflexota bacterium]